MGFCIVGSETGNRFLGCAMVITRIHRSAPSTAQTNKHTQDQKKTRYSIAWGSGQLERTDEGKIPKLVDELIGFVALT
jgi:hypothetical protein